MSCTHFVVRRVSLCPLLSGPCICQCLRRVGVLSVLDRPHILSHLLFSSLSLFFGTQGTCALTCAALLACPFGLSLALPGWAPSVMFCTSITVAVAAFKIVEFVLRRSPEGCVYSFGFRKCRTLIQEGGGEVMDTVIFFYSGDAGA